MWSKSPHFHMLILVRYEQIQSSAADCREAREWSVARGGISEENGTTRGHFGRCTDHHVLYIASRSDMHKSQMFFLSVSLSTENMLEWDVVKGWGKWGGEGGKKKGKKAIKKNKKQKTFSVINTSRFGTDNKRTFWVSVATCVERDYVSDWEDSISWLRHIGLCEHLCVHKCVCIYLCVCVCVCTPLFECRVSHIHTHTPSFSTS